MEKYAIISVSDKKDLDIVIEGLAGLGYSIISTGGTHKAISEIISSKKLGAKLLKVSDITKSPEMLGGRVKTLHPLIHGSILYVRDDPSHQKQASEHGLLDIDVVIINLYPFEQAMQRDAPDDELIEEIDIGGPTMLISSVKNHRYVSIITDPSQYKGFISHMQETEGKAGIEMRKKLAAAAINRLADYRGTIAQELSRRLAGQDTLRLSFSKGKKLGRYGENWHQEAWLYSRDGLACAQQLSGIDLGFNNYIDADASLKSLLEIADKPAASIIKHTNPCGYATGKDMLHALEMAWQGDEVSAFGSIITMSQKPDMDAVKFLDDKFVEVIIVPDIDEDVLGYLKAKKKNLRILKVGMGGEAGGDAFDYRSIDGGILKQSPDDRLYLPQDAYDLVSPKKEMTDTLGKTRTVGVVTKRQFPKDMLGLVKFALKSCKHLKSNAISICYEYKPGQYMLLGMGCGQPNRVNSTGLAVAKAIHNLRRMYDEPDTEQILGSDKVVLGSDAFFPFRDNIDLIAKSGISHIVQPGGSVKDSDVIAACDEHGIAMLFTGMRHFRH